MRELESIVGQIQKIRDRYEQTRTLDLPPFWIWASVVNSAAQAIPTGTVTTLLYDTELADTDGIHSTVGNTDRLTCVTAGRYLAGLNGRWASNATGLRAADIIHNGLTVITTELKAPVSGGETYHNLYKVVDLVAGDFLRSRCFQTSGGNLDWQRVSDFAFCFWMIRIA